MTGSTKGAYRNVEPEAGPLPTDPKNDGQKKLSHPLGRPQLDAIWYPGAIDTHTKPSYPQMSITQRHTKSQGCDRELK